jgi:hypothetical protein
MNEGIKSHQPYGLKAKLEAMENEKTDNTKDEKQQYTATIITYDVWGNDTDGYDINDKHKHGTYDFSASNYDINNDIDIIDFLQDVYFANPVKLSDIDIEGDIECCYVNDAKNGKPILEIIFNQI